MIIGPYNIERVLAVYDTATEYVAVRVNSEQDVLLTVIPPRPASDPFKDALKQRLDAIRWLNHPNLQPFKDAGYTEDGTYYKAFDWLPLAIPADEILAPDYILALSEQVCAALDYAHEQGVTHGSISRNVISEGANGQILLRGFELAAENGSPAEDVTAFAALSYTALTGQEGDVNTYKGVLPRSLITVFRHANRGGFETAGAFHGALARALRTSGLDLSQPLTTSLPSSQLRGIPNSSQAPNTIDATDHAADANQEPKLSRPSLPRSLLPTSLSPILIISILIPVIGGVLGVVLLMGSGRGDPATPTAVANAGSTATPSVPANSVTLGPVVQTKIPTRQPTKKPVQPTTPPTATIPASAVPPTAAATLALNVPTSGATTQLGAVITDAPPGVPTTPATANPANATPLPDAVINADDGVILRGGPDRSYYAITTLAKDTALILIARTSDSTWLHIRAGNDEGWVSADFVTVNANLPSVAVVTAEEIARLPRTRNCVNVAGDSVAHGDGIFDLPGIGYIFVSFKPLSAYIEQAFRDVGTQEIKVIDRSVSGTGISFATRATYTKTTQYKSLLSDRCKFTIITPWVGDLSSSGDPTVSAPVHASALAAFVSGLVQYNPYGRVLVLNYYKGAPETFIRTVMAAGFTPDGVSAFNKAIADQCTQGDLAKLKQVTCIDSNPIFASLGIGYVVSPMTREQVEQDIVTPLDDNKKSLLDTYLKTYPNGPLIGDGIHLNNLGKTTISAYLVRQMLSLPDISAVAEAAQPTSQP